MLDVFWRQFLQFFYSFESLCHKPCCQPYPFGISQSSVKSTNIPLACFQKYLPYRRSQWKMVRKALCWVEFMEEICCVKNIFKLNQCSHLHEQCHCWILIRTTLLRVFNIWPIITHSLIISKKSLPSIADKQNTTWVCFNWT